MHQEISNIANQFINIYNPQKLLLFGSQAKNTAGKNSDIDLCVVIDATDKRSLLTDMYLNIESSIPFDLLLYTPDEWSRCLSDRTSFAYKINKEGVALHA